MHKLLGLLPLAFLLGAVSSSSTLQLNNYSLGTGSGIGGHSTTYYVEGTAGQVLGTSSTGTTDTTNSGSLSQQQAAVPSAPTLSNGSNTYYNKLLLTLNTTGYPTDTVFSVAISTDNFTTTNYVQADGTVAATPVYRTAVQWGGGSGSYIVGLLPATTYKVKANAMQGMYTASAYGPAATQATVTPSLQFSLTPNTLTLNSLTAGTIITSSPVSLTYSTNGAAGGFIYLLGQNGGLASAANGYTIASSSVDLAGSATEGFGAQSTAASGASFTAQPPFNGGGNVVGAITTSMQPLYTATAPVTGATATWVLQAKAGSTTPAATDYKEVLSVIAAASF